MKRDMVERRMRWIDAYLLAPRHSSDPSFANRIGVQLRGFVMAHVHRSREMAARHIVNMGSLPSEIREAVINEPIFAQVLAEPPGAVRFGVICFDAREYYAAAYHAFQSGAGECRSTTGLQFQLRSVAWIGARLQGIVLALATGDPLFQDFNSLYVFLADILDEQRLNDLLETCEMDAERRRLEFERIRAAAPVERLLRARDLLSKSSMAFYVNLLKQLREAGQVDQDCVMPPAESLLAYLGFENFTDSVEAAAQRLASMTSLRTAIVRWSTVPMPLPAALTSAFQALSRAERRTLAKYLIRNSITPLSIANFAPLIVDAAIPASLTAIASRLMAALCRAADGEALHRAVMVARWTANELSRSPEVESWPDATYVAAAWAASAELLRAFASARVAPAWISSTFGTSGADLEECLFAYDRRMDATHPSNVEPETLLLAAAYQAIAGGARCDERSRSSILGLVTRTVDGGSQFKDSLFFESTRLRNVLGSALGAPRDLTLRVVCGEDAAKYYSIQAEHSELESEVSDEMYLPDASLVHYLWVIFGDAPVQEPWMREAVDAWSGSVASGIATGYAAAYDLWRFLARNAHSSSDDQVVQRLRDDFPEMLRTIAALTESERLAGAEIGAVVVASLGRGGDRRSRLACMAQGLSEILDHVPGSGEVVTRMAIYYLRRVPADSTAYFADVLLKARLR